MSYQTSVNTYRQNSILTMSQEELVPLMYEHLLVSLRRAAKQIRERDIEGKAGSVEKASGILYELLSSLDFDAGGEVATHLAALYTFILNELAEASRTLNAEKIEPLIEMVSSLNESWQEITQNGVGPTEEGLIGGQA